MAKLTYTAIMSLDGYIEDEDGNFDWAVPDDAVHAFINDRERTVGTYLYGRRMYETMAGWETMDLSADLPAVMRDFAELWRAAEKIVFSTTLSAPTTTKMRLERTFNPEEIRRLIEEAERDLSIAGPGLAAHAFEAGLVNECAFYVAPVTVGGGKRALPESIQLDLNLVDERRFEGGMMYLRYGVEQ